MLFIQVLIDLCVWIWEHREEVTVFGVINFIAVAFAKRIGVNQLKRLLHMRTENNELQEIKEDIRAIKQHLGVVVSGNSRSVTVGNGRLNSVQLWIGYLKAIPANQYLSQYKRRVNKLGNINKAILLPLLAAISVFLKEAFGVEVTDDQLDMYANLVLFLLMVLGIFMSPKKKTQKPEVANAEHYADTEHSV